MSIDGGAGLTPSSCDAVGPLAVLAEDRALVRAGRKRPREVVEAALDRIRRLDPRVEAWAFLDEDRARREAELARSDLLLSGATIGVKDIIDTGDQPTEYGSPIYAGHRPKRDAACVARLRQAGAIVLGKTVTTEFAYFAPGKTRNPHDPERTPGGSSSGSAAAVAAGMCHVALGTQTAGSVIRPASYCGVVGYKPTLGMIDLTGVRPLARSLDTLGVFGRTVEDVAAVAAVLARRDELADLGAPGAATPRLGFLRSYQRDAASAAGQLALDRGFERAVQAGSDSQWIELPGAFDRLVDAQKTLIAFEASDALAAEYAVNSGRMSPQIEALILEGQRHTWQDGRGALDLAAEANGLLESEFDGIDAFVTLSAPDEAPRGLSATGDPIFNRVWTLLGVPAVSVPGLSGASGLPIGLQIIGRRQDDRRALWSAAWLQRILSA